VHGGVDPQADGRAINARALRAALAKSLGATLGANEEPGAVAYRDAKTQRALEAIAAERGGDGAVARFQAEFEKSSGRPARRVNPALALLGEGSDDEAFYRALFEELVRTTPSPATALAELGRERASAVLGALTESGALGKDRVVIGIPTSSTAEKNGVASRLELDALAQAR
jgi:hypothetical protein